MAFFQKKQNEGKTKGIFALRGFFVSKYTPKYNSPPNFFSGNNQMGPIFPILGQKLGGICGDV